MTSDVAPEISVVVPTYRRPDDIARFLASLRTQTLNPARFELVVVDNCSQDAAVDRSIADGVAALACRTQVLRTEVNRGPAAARNLGWQAATAPIVAFADDDVVAEPGWLAAGLAAFDDPGVGVVQGCTRAPEGVDVHSLPLWTTTRVIEGFDPRFSACNVLYRRRALEQTGGFGEDMGFWGEDTAAGWRVLTAGWRAGYADGAVVVHGVERRPLSWYFATARLERNEIALAARFPGFRHAAFWRPWAMRRRDAAFALAAVSAVAGLRWRPAWLGILPYLWVGRPSVRRPGFVRSCVEVLCVDATRSATHLTASMREHILVL